MFESKSTNFPSEDHKHLPENDELSKSHFDDKNSSYRKRQLAHPNSVIGVFGLSDDTTESDLKKAFSPFGEIKKINLIFDRQTSRFKCFAFIYFETVEEATYALTERHETELNGSIIRIDFSATARTPYSRGVSSEFRLHNDPYDRRRYSASNYDREVLHRNSHHDFYDRPPTRHYGSYSRTPRRYESPERSSMPDERYHRSHPSSRYQSPSRRSRSPIGYRHAEHLSKSHYGRNIKDECSPRHNERPYSHAQQPHDYMDSKYSSRYPSNDYTQSPPISPYSKVDYPKKNYKSY